MQDSRTIRSYTTLGAVIKSMLRGPEPVVTAPQMGTFKLQDPQVAPYGVDSPEPDTTVVSEDQVVFLTMLDNHGRGSGARGVGQSDMWG